MNGDPDVREVQIFVSSPGDVMPERERIDLVAQRLNKAFSDRVRIKTVRWERKVFGAHEDFQTQIPPAAGADLVIAIFWARLGSPLPEKFGRMDNGERYPSGTAYEVLSAIDERKKSDRPDVYVFRKTEAVAELADDAKVQWLDLNGFFTRWFQTPDGQFLRAYHRFETADEFEALVERLLRSWIAEHVPHDATLIWPTETEGSPFRGLLPFDAKHAAVYFGRDRKVTRAIEQLQSVARPARGIRSAPRNVPFLLIVGESGAGKSSLMRAGLAPRLTAPGVVPAVDLWRIAVARIGDDPNPCSTLAEALFVENDEQGGFGAALPELCESNWPTPAQFAELLAQGGVLGARKRAPASRPILAALGKIQQAEMQKRHSRRRLRANLLLLIDQLENIFAANITDQQRSAFARLIFALCATRRVWVVGTARSDIYPRFVTPGDFLALKDAGGVYDLAAPGESELTEIVHKSAAAAGLVYETDELTKEGLDERILRDAQGENTLPLLEFALERLFEKRLVIRHPHKVVRGDATCTEVRQEIRLTFDAYDKIGGLDGAIDQTATAAVAKLGPAERAALPRLLRCLAVPVHDAKAVATREQGLTVRKVPAAEAIRDEATARLVHALIAARIVVATGSEVDKAPTEQASAACAAASTAQTIGASGRTEGEGPESADFIAIAHQRVLESWGQARKILAAERDFFRIREEVEAQFRRWKENKRPTALLLAKGLPLAEGQKIVNDYGSELDPELCRFVRKSWLRAQLLNSIMAIAVVAFAALALWAFVQKRTADVNFGVANETANKMITGTGQGLRNQRYINVGTINIVLRAINEAIDGLKEAYRDNPLVDLSRASVDFEFAKTYQQTDHRPVAWQEALDSWRIRARLTNYDASDPSLHAFNAKDGERWWDLSNSLELLGDLDREEAKDRTYKTSPDDQRRFRIKARERFLQSLTIRQRLAEAFPDNDDWVIGPSLSYVRLGDLSNEEHDAKAAQERYLQALENTARRFRRKPDSAKLQRELSWDFNKLGDIELRGSAGAAKSPAASRAATQRALADFENSLCIRRRLLAANGDDLLHRRDVSYALVRIADAKMLLDDRRAEAQAAYFESLAIRRGLLANDAHDARYVDDAAFTLQKIGDLYRSDDPETALAFYQSALEVRANFLRGLSSETEPIRYRDAQRSFLEAQKLVQSLQSKIDAGKLAALPDGWWRARVAEVAKEFPTTANTANCWAEVMASVERLIIPQTMANVH